MELTETIIRTQTVFSGRIFSVEQMDVFLPDGSAAVRQVVRNPGAAAVVALDDRNRAAMVRQYRTAVGRVMLELPAGKLEPGEDPLLCAQRELMEETGLTAGRWQKLAAMRSSPGFCDEVLHLFLARDLTQGENNLDDDEFLTLSWVPLCDLLSMIDSGDLADAKSITALLLALRKLEERK